MSLQLIVTFSKRFQKNREGQAILASTLIPQPHPTTRDPLEDDVNMSFGRCQLLSFLLSLSQFCFLKKFSCIETHWKLVFVSVCYYEAFVQAKQMVILR